MNVPEKPSLEALSAELHEARAFLDRIIPRAHALGQLSVAVECFLAQANLQAAIERLEQKRLEALEVQRLLLASEAAAPRLRPGEHDAFPKGRWHVHLASLTNQGS